MLLLSSYEFIEPSCQVILFHMKRITRMIEGKYALTTLPPHFSAACLAYLFEWQLRQDADTAATSLGLLPPSQPLCVGATGAVLWYECITKINMYSY